jgi:hypothetical protein
VQFITQKTILQGKVDLVRQEEVHFMIEAKQIQKGAEGQD